MQTFSGTTSKPQMVDNNKKNENGLEKLVVHYQSLFEIEENYNYYSRNEYQNAKRKFVKYLLNNRIL
jgi:hypothetical protein